jgi:hypothetical protein
MAAYFGRHKKDQNARNFGNIDNPSRGYMAWLNWGGTPGYKWALKQVRAKPNPDVYDPEMAESNLRSRPKSRHSRRNGNDSPIPDPNRPYFKVPMKELVAMARQGDEQAIHELEVHRGRDPKTGKKMFGVAAKFSKGAI